MWQGNYCGAPPIPAETFTRWNFDPFALVVLVVLALWVGRSKPGASGMIVLAFVFLSPLCALSSALFSARVVHHVVLVAVAAPLCAFNRTAGRTYAAGLPYLLATAALWFWHLPFAYDAALGNMALYWLMQASLFGSAFFFWSAVFSHPDGAGLGWVFLAYLSMGMLGAILTLTPDAVYATHSTAPIAWGMMPLADQQLGGLIMWMPAALPFGVWGGMLALRAWRACAEDAL
jgi:putative membrane protein